MYRTKTVRGRGKADGREKGKESKVEEQQSGVRTGWRNSRASAMKVSKA